MRLALVLGWPKAQTVTTTTVWLFAQAWARGHDVVLVDYLSLELDPAGRVFGLGLRPTQAPPAPGGSDEEALDPPFLARERAAVVRALDLDHLERRRRCLSDFDLVIFRVNPTQAHSPWPARVGDPAELFGPPLRAAGVTVVNGGPGLAYWAGPFALTALPAGLAPPTLVSRDVPRLRAFLEGLDGPGVIKPARGSGGQGVFRVPPGARDPNLPSLLAHLAAQGYVVAQAFVPEARQGDLRALLWKGSLLRLGGSEGPPSVYRRVHAPGDFRNNVHAGGRAEAVRLDPRDRAALEALGPLLRAAGLLLVGVDLVGGKVLELNVHAPGGLHNLSKVYGRNAAASWLDALEAQARSHD